VKPQQTGSPIWIGRGGRVVVLAITLSNTSSDRGSQICAQHLRKLFDIANWDSGSYENFSDVFRGWKWQNHSFAIMSCH
jgi:hypothetical protein